MFHIFSRCPTFLSYSFWGLLQMKDKSPEHLIHLHSKTSEEFYIKASNRTAETKMLWPIGTARIFAMVTTSCKHILYTLLLDLGVQSWSWRGRSTPFKHDSWSSNSWKHLTCSWSNHNKSVFYGGPVHINHHFPMVFPSKMRYCLLPSSRWFHRIPLMASQSSFKGSACGISDAWIDDVFPWQPSFWLGISQLAMFAGG